MLFGAVLALAPTTTFAATTQVKSGYWWVAQPDGAPLPPPPQVPSGGLWVSSTVSGPQSISAVRFTLAAGASQPVLTLKVHQAQPASQVTIEACSTSSNWKPPGSAGAWSARPTPACATGSVAGVLSADGTTMTFDLSLLQQPDNVVLQAAPSTPMPTFDATFEPLTASSVQPAVEGPPPTTTTTTAPPPTTVPPPSNLGAPLPAGNGLGGPPAPSPPAPTGAALGASPALPAPVAPTAPGANSSAGPVLPNSTPALASASAPVNPHRLTARGRWLLLSVLVDIGVLAWIGSGQRATRPRLSLLDGPPTEPSLGAGRRMLQAGREGKPTPLR